MNKLIQYKVSNVIEYANNPRKNDHAVDKMAAAIKEFGFRIPLLIQSDGVLVDGHLRLKAAKKLGMEEVPALLCDDMTPAQIKAFRLSVNKMADLAEWDEELLKIELDALSELDFDMSCTGFDDKEILDMFPEEPTEGLVADDEIPEPKEAICELGDLWQLGKHRLLCGDSTDSGAVAVLMNKENAKFLFTSPPYSDMRDYGGDKELSVSHIAKFISAFHKFTSYQCVKLGIQRHKYEIVEYWNSYIETARSVGYKLLAWNVWDKCNVGSVGLQSAMFPLRHEWIFVFGEKEFEINRTCEKKLENINVKRTRKARRRADGTFESSSVGDTSLTHKQMESIQRIMAELGPIRSSHPATFPVELPQEYILAMSNSGDIVADAFGGSGSTLIACEKTNRKCYMMELEPKYCDVIIERFESFTGEQATLISKNNN